jgi:hypothetical protein
MVAFGPVKSNARGGIGAPVLLARAYAQAGCSPGFFICKQVFGLSLAE